MKKPFLPLLYLIYPVFLMAQNIPLKNAEEIIGCWEKIDVSKETKKQQNEIEPWPTQYQWFCFERDGTLYTMGSDTYTKQTSKSLHETFKTIPKDITYTVMGRGFIKTEQKSPKQNLFWESYFMGTPVTFDGKVLEKGTFVMSLFNPLKQKNIYYRYMKKLP